MNKLLLMFGLILCLAGYVGAYAVGTLLVNDADGVMDFGTTYNFNATVSGVTDEAYNVTACTINGVSMVGPGGNGTGLWNYSGTVDSFDPDMSENCTYTVVTVSCTNGTAFTTTNSSWTALPCIESSTDWANTDAISGSSTYLQFDAHEFDRMNAKSNMTPVTNAANTYCTVQCIISKQGGGTQNLTVYTPEQTYNSTHKYCPYDCFDVDYDTVQVKTAGYLKTPTPEAAFGTTWVMVTIFGMGALAAASYGIGKRRGRRA